MATTSGDKKGPQDGGVPKGGNGGKTNEQMLKKGRNLAKVANQKRK